MKFEKGDTVIFSFVNMYGGSRGHSLDGSEFEVLESIMENNQEILKLKVTKQTWNVYSVDDICSFDARFLNLKEKMKHHEYSPINLTMFYSTIGD